MAAVMGRAKNCVRSRDSLCAWPACKMKDCRGLTDDQIIALSHGRRILVKTPTGARRETQAIDPEIAAQIHLGLARQRRTARNHHIVQGCIMALSTIAIFLVDHFDGHGMRFAGNLVGLLSQPFWLWSTWQHRQWGMFINAVFYAGVWSAGVYRYGPGALDALRAAGWPL